MSTIIAGRFDSQAQADAAMQSLARAGLQAGEYGTFFLNPAGQHAIQSVGGDAPHHSEGTKHAGKTAATGAGIGGVTGLAIGTVVAAATEPGFTAVAAIAGAGVGAFAGSLAGGLAGSRQSDPEKASREEPAERDSGVMVAVCVDRDGMEERAIEALRAGGAQDIERAEGEWRDGMWADFDPLRTAQLVH